MFVSAACFGQRAYGCLQNIERAKKEIERLETEAKEPPTTSNRRTHDAAKKPSTKNQAVNGTANAETEQAQEKDAADDVAKDLKETSIEDQEES